MKKDTKHALRELAYYSSLGLSVSLAIFIGLAVGVYLDRRFDTVPWCTLIFLVLGMLRVSEISLWRFEKPGNSKRCTHSEKWF